MLEREVWHFIKAAEVNKPRTRWMRCENAVASGVPDINACIDGREFWIELKCPKKHARESTPVFGGSHKISAMQLSWFRRQAAAGGHGFVIVSNEQNTLLLDGAYLSSAVNQMTLDAIKATKGLCLFHAPADITQAWGRLRIALLSALTLHVGSMAHSDNIKEQSNV